MNHKIVETINYADLPNRMADADYEKLVSFRWLIIKDVANRHHNELPLDWESYTSELEFHVDAGALGYTVTIEWEMTWIKCEDCGRVDHVNKNAWKRLDWTHINIGPGDRIPSEICPNCGNFMYPSEEE